jgi:hypothetical protein
MWKILQKLREWWAPPPAPASGPRRVKHYAAQTGFQYQYQLRSSTPGDYEFLLWTTSAAARLMRITVPLTGLAARDRYALAKLHLFRNLDEHEPADLPRQLEITDTAALDEL